MDEYGFTATLYDRCLTPLLSALRIDIRTFIQYRGYHRIIDICCGTGDQLQLLENGAEELVGIDNSVAMLAKARQNCSDNVALHLVEAEQLDFPPRYFDCAIVSFALHEKHQTLGDLIFSNAKRIVKQGGSIIITDYSRSSTGLKGFLLGDILIPVVERLAGRPHYLNYLSWKRDGGIEGFLQKQRQTKVDVISRRFGGTVFCCAVSVDDDTQTYQKHLALLNRAFPTPIPDQRRRS